MDTQVQAPVPDQAQVQEHRFSFTGTGAEYFRIWIVNLVLTILTLGIFSAWAKVRRLQYFYRNTHMGGSSFDYHGSPIAILKGRIIGLLLFAAYTFSFKFNPLLWLCVVLCIGLIMPYLLATSFRFRLYNSSYRGLRFGFTGSVGGAYGVFLGLPLAAMFTMYLLAPLAHHRIKAYQHNNSRFGQTPFSFNARELGFYKIYLVALLQWLALMLTLGIIAAVTLWSMAGGMSKERMMIAVVMVIYGVMIVSSLLISPYFQSRMQNLIWNGTRLQQSGFSSTMRARKLAWIVFSNFFLIILTLGLYKPFAAVRLARYRMEQLAFLSAGSMDEFIASEQQQAGAAGMETAEFFDIDVGL